MLRDLLNNKEQKILNKAKIEELQKKLGVLNIYNTKENIDVLINDLIPINIDLIVGSVKGEYCFLELKEDEDVKKYVIDMYKHICEADTNVMKDKRLLAIYENCVVTKNKIYHRGN